MGPCAPNPDHATKAGFVLEHQPDRALTGLLGSAPGCQQLGEFFFQISLWGLGALPTSEVIYVSAITDEQGAPLQGKHHYRFRIPPQGIPAEAFWSLTMYEVDPFGGMCFTAHPLKRYAIGDRTAGLVKKR